MLKFAIIGGSGSAALVPADHVSGHVVDTPYGPPSAPVRRWQEAGVEIHFLARHGDQASIPPHCVNYRANVWALAQVSPACIVGLNAVGGISPAARPGRLVFPDQLVDYSWGREHTYAEAMDRPVQHVDFTHPVTPSVHAGLVEAANRLGYQPMERGTYGVTQGPRLETAAEIDRLERDGCDVVGMTAMPEAALARELGLDYALCAVVVNFAAGRGPAGQDIHAEIAVHLAQGMQRAADVLRDFFASAGSR